MERAHLYLWLTTIIIRSVAYGKKITEVDHKRVVDHVKPVFNDTFLMTHGKKYSEYVCLVTRAYSDYLIKIEKPIAGIAQIMKAIKHCRESEEEVSALHNNFAMLCIKAK